MIKQHLHAEAQELFVPLQLNSNPCPSQSPAPGLPEGLGSSELAVSVF